MPHLDFRQAFSSPSDDAPVVAEASGAPVDFEELTARNQRLTLATRLPRLHKWDRTTILFAILIFVGGLFCAFYFFNGAEILRAAAAWSREFLYPRPSALVAETDKIDNSRLPGPSGQTSPQADKTNPDSPSDTSPFSRNLGSLYSPSTGDSTATTLNPGNPLNPGVPGNPGLPPTTLPPDPGSLLDQLNLPPLGGGALAQTFERGVAEISRITALYQNSTPRIVSAPVSLAVRKARTQTKPAVQKSVKQIGNAQQKIQNAKAAEQQAMRVSGGRLQDANTAVFTASGRTGSGTGLQSLGGGLGSGSAGGASGLGIGSALGGASGMGPGGGGVAPGGGTGGGVVGTVGGIVGSVGGIGK